CAAPRASNAPRTTPQRRHDRATPGAGNARARFEHVCMSISICALQARALAATPTPTPGGCRSPTRDFGRHVPLHRPGIRRADDHDSSVVRAGIELGKEHAGEAEAGEVADAHRIERADEVIAFVLDDARVEALGLALERPPLDVDAAIADAREARHHA